MCSRQACFVNGIVHSSGETVPLNTVHETGLSTAHSSFNLYIFCSTLRYGALYWKDSLLLI